MKIKNTIYRISRFIKTYYLLLKYLILLKFRHKESSDKIALVYLMNKKIYFLMALICISSFLYYNKDFKVHVYCDDKLLNLCKLLRYIFNTDLVQVFATISEKSDPMLEQVKMFTKTTGGNIILMDADIRWTGKLIYDFEKPLVYNFESNENHIKNWKIISSYLKLNQNQIFKMYTCCIISLGKTNLTYTESEINLILQKMADFNWKEISSFNNPFHIRGQFIISYLLSEIGQDPCSVISIQASRGKMFLETSFYGATGYRFGK